ncbi:MAG: hypothetical protein ABI134_05795 [Byssovorax sp.]
MARQLSELLEPLARIVAEDSPRRAAADACSAAAAAMGSSLLWVHRTGRAGDWRHIFEVRRLVANETGTPFEKALGIERAVYFFVGACAYPTGILALLVAPLVGTAHEGTFTPYDTGALKKHIAPEASSEPWDVDAKTRHLEAHLGRSADVIPFLGPYLSGHFREPVAYVRVRPGAQPDFPAYHGLVEIDKLRADRRAWTLEAQLHADVEIPPDGLLLEEIWLDHQDLLEDLPDDFKRLARILPDGVPLAVAVAERIEERLMRASS